VPGQMIFVDDKTENVDAARRVGLWFEGTDTLCGFLRSLILSAS
jgi:hypothetical protein